MNVPIKVLPIISHAIYSEHPLLMLCPKSQRSPVPLNSEVNPASGNTALAIHDASMVSTCMVHNTRDVNMNIFGLFIVGYEIVDIEYSQFESAHHESCGIYTALAVWKQFCDEFVLSFFEALHSEWHAAEHCYLFLGVA